MGIAQGFFSQHVATDTNSLLTSSQESDTPVEKSSFGDFFGCSMKHTVASKKTNLIKAVSKVRDLEREIKLYSEFIDENSNIIQNIRSTASFWKKKKDKIPTLYQLSLKLSGIPSTSAMIERLFSIAGLVCDNRRPRMTNKLITMRYMLKANMALLVDNNVEVIVMIYL